MVVAIATPPATAPERPRFDSLKLPRAPFWVVLLGLIVLTIALSTAAPTLLVFGIGGALSFFLVPVVNWMERKGVPRIAASALVVAVMVVAALAAIFLSTFILVEQGVVFVQALPGWLEGIRPTSMR